MNEIYRISPRHNVKLKAFKRLRILNIIFSVIVALFAVYMLAVYTKDNSNVYYESTAQANSTAQPKKMDGSLQAAYEEKILLLESQLAEKQAELDEATEAAKQYSEEAHNYYKEYLNYYVLYEELRNSKFQPNTSATFTIGSSMDDVLKAMGNPSKIEDTIGYGSNLYSTVWYYGKGSTASTVTFNTNTKKVIAWEENGTELKLS